MPANRPNPGDFDEMLGRALRRHSEPVPADFTARMLRQARELDEKRIVSRVIWQGRLALAGTILLGVAAIVGILALPGRIGALLNRIGMGFTDRGGALIGRFPQAVGAVRNEWQLYAVLAVLLAFAVFCLLDLLVGDRVKMA
jgi:hypothetical protein